MQYASKSFTSYFYFKLSVKNNVLVWFLVVGLTCIKYNQNKLKRNRQLTAIGCNKAKNVILTKFES